MKVLKLSVLCTAFITLLSCGSSQDDNDYHNGGQHCFYVDASNGSDDNDGSSPDRAWKTVIKVNSVTFQPGDSILFKSGCEFSGQLRPVGSGIDQHPICISNYGSGNLPIINQKARTGAVVLLRNQEYWEIKNLEINGGTSKPLGLVAGIRVQTTAKKVLNHIVISDCVIRNTNGSIKLYESSAIWVGVPGSLYEEKTGLETSFNDVLIENNKIYGSDRNGILVWTPSGPGPSSQFKQGLIPSENVVIRNNYMEDIGGDGIIVLGSNKPLVERNVVKRCCLKVGDTEYGNDGDYNTSSAGIWFHHCSNGIMQYNAVYDCKKLQYNNDGIAFDFDFNCDNNILQYNYSSNNAGGFLLMMGTATNNIARYNISENDYSHVIFCFGSTSNKIYNNTIYIDKGASYIIPGGSFYNNIFMCTGSGRMSVQNPSSGIFQHNCYVGNWNSSISDNNAINSDPLFVNPGKGYENADNFVGYMLQANSPCRKAGAIIENNGGLDIFGNKLPQSSVDLGATQNN
jgi:hypothetical protein